MPKAGNKRLQNYHSPRRRSLDTTSAFNMEKALVWSFLGHYKNTLHSKNIFCCRTETRTDDDGKSYSETVTDYHRNHEAYTKQEVVVHNGPALPPVLSTSPHDTWIVVCLVSFQFIDCTKPDLDCDCARVFTTSPSASCCRPTSHPPSRRPSAT